MRPVKFFDVWVAIDPENREFLASIIQIKILSVFAARFELDCDNPAVGWTFALVKVNFVLD